MLPTRAGRSVDDYATFSRTVFSQLTNHGTPNRSTTLPNRSAQKVSAIGICTMPSSARALKMRSASWASLGLSITQKLCGFLYSPGIGITALQHAVPEGEAGMQDLLGPTRRCLAGHRSTFPRHHEGDLASQAFLVKLKGLLALAVKVKVGIQRHWVPNLRCELRLSLPMKLCGLCL